MLFNSFEYILFLPTVAILFFVLPHKHRWILLLAASYFFYMYWDPKYALLLAGSTLISYYSGYKMGQVPKAKRLPYLYLSIISSLGILTIFKYLNFLTDSANKAAELLNIAYAAPALAIILPVGVSFYLFQTMSYAIDVYNDKIKPEKHLGIYSLYVSFFPQLVAGPIERAGNILPQLRTHVSPNQKRILDGLKLIVWGLFKKIVVADRIAALVNEVYNNAPMYEGAPLLLATVLFSFQIYCDFSGYSDIAIGTAQIFGIKLMDNFKRP
ncbi:MBOAT family protein, partial [Candidatus Peregrinibacteria bacterium]|nr:MBOAT family protein [Candidatus Peregrinibacteria bacterium]